MGNRSSGGATRARADPLAEASSTRTLFLPLSAELLLVKIVLPPLWLVPDPTAGLGGRSLELADLSYLFGYVPTSLLLCWSREPRLSLDELGFDDGLSGGTTSRRSALACGLANGPSSSLLVTSLKLTERSRVVPLMDERWWLAPLSEPRRQRARRPAWVDDGPVGITDGGGTCWTLRTSIGVPPGLMSYCCTV